MASPLSNRVLSEALPGDEGTALRVKQVLLVAFGVAALAVAAKIKVPFWPVPITMQTFVVLTIGAAYGLRLGVGTVLAYLAIGALGFDVFTSSSAEANGISPIEFVVARDAIAVVVHPANPVDGLTLHQISDIYTRKVTNWRQVRGEDRPIVRLSRESNSGTYVYFLENVIRLGEKESDLLFSPDTLLMPSSEGISAEVRQNPNAIGYDGLGYVTHDQKMLAVARASDSPYVLPSVETVNDGSYPVSRPLYMYTAGEPTGQIEAYLDWLLSDGQSLVSELGFVPLGGSAD